MYPVSTEYSTQMRKPIREAQAHATVFLGVFDKTASKDAVLDVPEATSYSKPENLTASPHIVTSYATFEGSGFRLDGEQALLPDNNSALAAQGFVGQEISDSEGKFDKNEQIVVDFGSYHDMIGVSLTFDEQFPRPTELTVTGYRDGAVVQSIHLSAPIAAKANVEESFESINRLVVDFVKVVPNGRARLNSLDFGLGYTYKDRQLISVVEKHQGSPVSISLPNSTFEFTLFNENNVFGLNNTSEIARFLTEGQKATVDYSVSWDGGTQEIPGGVWSLKSWTVDRFSATFQLENALSALINTEFTKGVYDQKPHSLFELAESVFKDAKVTSYYIDPYLKDVYTTSPLPIVSHAEALQLIANAGLSKLYVDRIGRICIEASVSGSPIVTSATAQAPYSKPESVLNAGNVEFMTFEPQFARVDGSQKLVADDPEDSASGGWATDSLSASGVYPDNEIVLSYLAPINVASIKIDWGSRLPASAEISCKVDGEWQTPITIHPTALVENYELNFVRCTEVKISLLEGESNRRASILQIGAIRLSDFTLDKNQVYEDSQEAIEVKLKNVSTNWLHREIDAEGSSTSNVVIKTNSGVVELRHDLATDLRVVVERGGKEATDVTVEAEHYAYASYIKLISDTDEELDVHMVGSTVRESEIPLNSVANKEGETQEIFNPLFDSEEIAQRVADWVKAYYSRRVVYDYNVRGFPELDYGDTVYLGGDTSAVITNLELSYNGAFNGSMRLRR